MKEPKQDNKDLIENIKDAIFEYSRKNKKPPTLVIINSKLFKILNTAGAIVKKQGTKKTEKGAFQRYMLTEDYRIDIYTQEEICINHNSKLVGKALNMELPFTLGRSGTWKKFKKLSHYNICSDHGTFVQGRA